MRKDRKEQIIRDRKERRQIAKAAALRGMSPSEFIAHCIMQEIRNQLLGPTDLKA